MAPNGYKIVPEIPTVEMTDAALPGDETFGRGFKERIYKEMLAAAPEAPLAVVPLVDSVYEELSPKAIPRTSRENVVDVLHALISAELRAAPHDGSLQVSYGAWPESNGKSNFTAILHRGDISRGITIDRSEYPDRVRYEADRVRWLIGELSEEPFILDYDANKHSGYKAPEPEAPLDAIQRVDSFVRVYQTRRGLDQSVIHALDAEYELRPDDLRALVSMSRAAQAPKDERARFEDAFRDHGEIELERLGDGYKSPVTNCLWMGWKVRSGMPK
jgi:hypothetical protein